MTSAEPLPDQVQTEVEIEADNDHVNEGAENSQSGTIWKVLVVIGIIAGIYYLYSDLPAKSTPSNSENVENRRIYGSIGEQIEVKHFAYRVNGIKFVKSIGNEFYRTRADGIFLIVDLSLLNRDNVAHILDNSMFKLTDENGLQYQSSGEATTALLMNEEETLFLKQCNPQIQKQGLLAFEVPRKAVYDLHLSGGFWTGQTGVVRLVTRQ